MNVNVENYNKPQLFEGFQKIRTNVMLYWQMIKDIVAWCLAVQVVVFLLLTWVLYNHDGLLIVLQYLKALVTSLIFPNDQITVTIYGTDVTGRDCELAKALRDESHIWPLWVAFILSWGVWVAQIPAIVRRIRTDTKEQSETRVLRGSRFVTPEDVMATYTDGDLPIGPDLLMSRGVECEHVFIVGRPGVGKTTDYLQVIERLEQRINDVNTSLEQSED